MTVSHRELLELQYELAMAIGTSLQMEDMLRHTLSRFLRKLNCSSGCVYLCPRNGGPPAFTYAVPRRLRHNQAYRIGAALVDGSESDSDPEALCDRLPIQGGDSHKGYHHILPIQHIGYLILVRHGAPLSEPVLLALTPLLHKLGDACIACLQSQELAETNSRIRFERNLLRTMLDNMPVVLFVLDKTGKIIVSEGRGLGQLATTPEDAIGNNVFDVYRNKPQIINAVKMAIDGTASSITVRIMGSDYQVRYEPLFDQDGAVVNVVGAALDISEQVHAQQMLDQVLQSVGEGVVAIDDTGNMLLTNAMLGTIFGYSDREMIGQSIQMLMPEQYRTAHADAMNRYLRTGHSTITNRRLEMEGLRKDGQIFPLELFITETKLRNQPLFIGTVRDISRRKELDRMRDEFIATVSHELRTPLASTMGWMETLQGESPGPLTDMQRRFLNIAYKSAERLNKLVEEILTVSQIQSDRLKLSMRPFSPSETLHNMIQTVQPLAETRLIALDLQDECPKDFVMMGDLARLEQVLDNLIGNALKFSPERTTIHLRSSMAKGIWRVEVEDHGIGIPKDEQAKIFNRFYRASNASSKEIQGSGLGLHVVKAIVEAHDGSLGIKSEHGQGTTVWFEIPYEELTNRPKLPSDQSIGAKL